MADRLVTAEINLQRFASNFRSVRKLVGKKVAVMAVLKANAYGHGLIPLAKHAEKIGADFLGVAALGEAKAIRAAKIKTPILILNYIDPQSISEAVSINSSITVMDREVAQKIAKLNKKVNIHVKVDTGMHRAGCDPKELPEILSILKTNPKIEIEGLFTHFAYADGVNPSFTNQQIRVFNEAVKTATKLGVKPKFLHAAHGAGLIAFPNARFNLVRPGNILYGLNPFPPNHPKYSFTQKTFKPILSLKTQLVHVRKIAKGESVGYGRQFIAKRPTVVGLLPIGYGDGLSRSPFPIENVLVQGQFAPIIGRISMDQTTVDLTHIRGPKVHDEVVIIGKQKKQEIIAAEIAEKSQTIHYEVLTSLSARIVRKYTMR